MVDRGVGFEVKIVFEVRIKILDLFGNVESEWYLSRLRFRLARNLSRSTRIG